MRALLPLLLSLPLLAACGSDDPTGPGDEAAPTHYEITLQMSSIWAQNDCESTPGNPGDFRWRLVVRKPDGGGGELLVADTGVQSESVGDGVRAGVTMDPVSFLVRNAPGSEFEVEHWIGEYDTNGAVDFEKHSWATHRLDRREDQMWAAGSRAYESDRYTQEADGSGSGLYKFQVWNERSDCSGAACYYLTWTPITIVE